MNTQDIQTFNSGVKGMIESHITSQKQFHLVMETNNWVPELPESITMNEKVLFSFVHDTLRECSVEGEYVELFVATIDDDGNNSTHRYSVDEFANIQVMYSDVDGQPEKPFFIRPDYATHDFSASIESDLEHSKSMFLKNPDNKKFFE